MGGVGRKLSLVVVSDSSGGVGRQKCLVLVRDGSGWYWLSTLSGPS